MSAGPTEEKPAEKASQKVCRFAIVDDHPIVTRGIEDTFADLDGFELIGSATSEAEGLRLAEEAEPDVMIIDLALEAGSGLGLIKSVSSLENGTRMLVFTMHDEKLYAERTLRAGAHGFINKGIAPDKLVESVRDIASGQTVISEEINDRLLQRALGSAGSIEGVDALSDRELEVFELIGRGKSVRKIAKTLTISVKTVETHREHIKKKLGLATASELARFAVAWVENPG